MATTNGLPTLKIAFEKAAAQVANRSKKGYVAMMVRDASAQGVHLLSSDALIPSGLGEENKKHILTAFEGSDRGAPSLVILVVIKEGTEDTTALEGGLQLLQQGLPPGPGPVGDSVKEKLIRVKWHGKSSFPTCAGRMRGRDRS